MSRIPICVRLPAYVLILHIAFAPDADLQFYVDGCLLRGHTVHRVVVAVIATLQSGEKVSIKYLQTVG